MFGRRPRDPQDMEKLKNASKEAAVKHKRHWVRLTRLCNQRCIFCLDSWNQNARVDTRSSSTSTWGQSRQ